MASERDAFLLDTYCLLRDQQNKKGFDRSPEYAKRVRVLLDGIKELLERDGEPIC